LKNVRESLLHFGYEVLRADDSTLLAEGETTHIVVNSKFEKTVLPQKYARVLTKALEDSPQRRPTTVGSGNTRANR
jgi:acyl-CoA thioester hydrolase